MLIGITPYISSVCRQKRKEENFVFLTYSLTFFLIVTRPFERRHHILSNEINRDDALLFRRSRSNIHHWQREHTLLVLQISGNNWSVRMSFIIPKSVIDKFFTSLYRSRISTSFMKRAIKTPKIEKMRENWNPFHGKNCLILKKFSVF